MIESINIFSRMLVALLLCVGVVLTSCEGADPLGGENTEQGNDDTQPGEGDNVVTSGPLTGALEKVNWNSVTFAGRLDVPAADIPFSQVTVCYSDAENFNINDAQKASTTTFDADQKFTIIVTGLNPNVKYKYCLIAEVKSEKIYGTVQDFTPKAQAASGYTDLSTKSSANCFIISQSGSYCFPVVRGNASSDWLLKTTESEVLWESFGTDVELNVGDIIKSVYFEEGYISFKTANPFKEGNAVIAAKDASGSILWSWHIWLTDEPLGQEYYNNAGTMMDRNLGATSATPGDVGALGLLYQWGRKDPFLGSASITSYWGAFTDVKSTITWPSAVSSDSSTGTIAYATSNPTTFIKKNWENYEWYYPSTESTDNTFWTRSDKSKSIYDPCPSGWRVPDGGDNGVWSKALGSSADKQKHTYDSSNMGMNFSGKFGAASMIWYPGTACLDGESGRLYNNGEEDMNGKYWAVPADSNDDIWLTLLFTDTGNVYPSNGGSSADGLPVRCIQE